MVREKQFDAEQALDKAMEAFWAHGYAATSMQDLVDCMGINRASLYGTFGGKRELFLMALRRYDTAFRRERLAALDRLDSPKEAIRRLFEDWVDELSRQPQPRGCFLTNTAQELAPHDAEIGAFVADSQADIEDFLRRKIAEGKAAGEIPRTLAADTVAPGLLSNLLGMLVLARSRPERATLDAIARDAVGRLD